MNIMCFNKTSHAVSKSPPKVEKMTRKASNSQAEVQLARPIPSRRQTNKLKWLKSDPSYRNYALHYHLAKHIFNKSNQFPWQLDDIQRRLCKKASQSKTIASNKFIGAVTDVGFRPHSTVEERSSERPPIQRQNHRIRPVAGELNLKHRHDFDAAAQQVNGRIFQQYEQYFNHPEMMQHPQNDPVNGNYLIVEAPPPQC